MRNLDEDTVVPANIVGSGAIAGVGIGADGEPGRKNKKKLRDILRRMTPGETKWKRKDITQ